MTATSLARNGADRNSTKHKIWISLNHDRIIVFVVAVILHRIALYSDRKSVNEKEGVSHQYGSPCGICVGSAHSKSWHEFSSNIS
jgi:hypothetical protein